MNAELCFRYDSHFISQCECTPVATLRPYPLNWVDSVDCPLCGQWQSLTSCCGLHFPTRHWGWAHWWPSSGALFTGHWLRMSYCLPYLPSLGLTWDARWDLPPKHPPLLFSFPSSACATWLFSRKSTQRPGVWLQGSWQPGIRWVLKFLSSSCRMAPSPFLVLINTLLALGNTLPWPWGCGPSYLEPFHSRLRNSPSRKLIEVKLKILDIRASVPSDSQGLIKWRNAVEGGSDCLLRLPAWTWQVEELREGISVEIRLEA